MSPPSSGSSGLKRRLLYSHLSVAVVGLGILLIALLAILGIRANALNLALESAPAVKASLQAQSGIQQSLAALRGWVALGDSKFVVEWKKSWVEEIRPAMSDLSLLSQEWTDGESLEHVRKLLQELDDLQEWQWHIQDVAQTPGNHPPQAYMERYVVPLSKEVIQATALLLQFDTRENVGGRLWSVWLGDFRAAVMNTQSSLMGFLFSRDQEVERDFHRFRHHAQEMFLKIIAQPPEFSGDRQVVFLWMQDQFRGYQTSLSRLDELQRHTAWDIANHRLLTEAVPRAHTASIRLRILVNTLSSMMQEDTAWVTRISTLSLWGSLLLLVGLMTTTWWMARSRAEALSAPIVQLSQATNDLAQGKRSDRLHVTGTDELGQLAQSFNVMQEALVFREGELIDAGARTKGIVETAADGIITLNEHECIESFNGAAAKMFGFEAQEVLGQGIALLMPSPHRESHDGYLEGYGDDRGHKVFSVGREVTGRRKDGTSFPIEFSVSEVRLATRRIFTIITRDISERKNAEGEKERLNSELVSTSRRAGMADVAINVLHNVGNVLNSVNVSAGMVQQAIRRLSVDKISRTAIMINEHTENLGRYLQEDPKGQHIPEYLTKLGGRLIDEQTQALSEMEELNKNIEHIKEIVSAQQNMAKSGGVLEPLNPQEIMEQAIAVNMASMMRHGIEIVRDFHDMPEIIADKHQVLQILINLISNAKYAIMEKGRPPSRLTLHVSQEAGDEGKVIWRVTDTGKGITPENISRIFTQGFTTKKTGHGFGLHSAALSAKIMGGALLVHSDGEDQGATFTLELVVKSKEKSFEQGSRLVAGEQ